MVKTCREFSRIILLRCVTGHESVHYNWLMNVRPHFEVMSQFIRTYWWMLCLIYSMSLLFYFKQSTEPIKPLQIFIILKAYIGRFVNGSLATPYPSSSPPSPFPFIWNVPLSQELASCPPPLPSEVSLREQTGSRKKLGVWVRAVGAGPAWACESLRDDL